MRAKYLFLGYLAMMLLSLTGQWHLWLTEQLYQWQHQQWLWRDHWLTETVLHRGVRQLNTLLVIGLLSYFAWRLWRHGWQPAQQRLLLLVASLLLSFALVAYLKYLLQMDCPWDLQQFGGSKPYFALWQLKPATISAGRCFPAGHASIGYAWIALYFYWRYEYPQRARWALLLSLAFGILLGLTQQLRGAHFFVDDLTTAMICTSIPWLLLTRKEAYANTP